MTDAVIDALEAELRRQDAPLADRLAAIAQDLRSKAKPGGRDLTKDEIDALWGHS
jgi:antitoxin VapB